MYVCMYASMWVQVCECVCVCVCAQQMKWAKEEGQETPGWVMTWRPAQSTVPCDFAVNEPVRYHWKSPASHSVTHPHDTDSVIFR